MIKSKVPKQGKAVQGAEANSPANNDQSLLSKENQSFQVDATASLTKPKRMSVSLPGDIAGLLKFLADTQGISQNEALRKAIATEAYVQQEVREGSTILVQKSNKEIREVVFR